jgi:hypothetical protein
LQGTRGGVHRAQEQAGIFAVLIAPEHSQVDVFIARVRRIHALKVESFRHLNEAYDNQT